MPSCAIPTCKNTRTGKTNGEFGFHRFPKEKKIQKLWVQLCKRKDKFKPENAVICTDHFTSDQYDVDKVNRVLNLPERRILKPGSVPSVNLPHQTLRTPKGDPKKSIERAERLSLRNKQRQGSSSSQSHDLGVLVDDLINENNEVISNLEEKKTAGTYQNWNSTTRAPVPIPIPMEMEDPLPPSQIQECNSSDMKLLMNNSNFEQMLENVVVKCEPTCETCCQFLSQLGQHLLHGHSGNGSASDVSQVNIFKCDFCNETFLTTSDLQVHLNCHIPSVNKEDDTQREPFQPRILRKKKITISSQIPRGHRKTNSTLAQTIPQLESNFVFISGDIKREMEPEDIEIIESPSPFFIPDDDTNSEPENGPTKTKISLKNGRKRKGKDILKSKYPKQHKCGKCGECFENPYTLRTHNFKQHTEKTSYQCENCGEFFKTLSGLSHHSRMHEFPEKCGFCEEVKFSNFNEFIDHTTSAHTEILEKPYTCTICNIGFSKPNELDQHFGQLHPDSFDYVCEFCDKRFINQNRFKRHGLKHTEECPYMCEHCSKGFKTSFHLEKHINTHTKEKPYKCRFCEKSYYVEENLIGHEGIHKGVRKSNVKCEHCSEIFKYKKQLTTHLLQIHKIENTQNTLTQKWTRTPMEDKHRGCGICKHKCPNSKTLTTHLRTKHSDFFGQDFACKFCERKFFSERQLTTHMKQFHPKESPHECNICHKKFEWRDQLIPHYRLHTGEKPFTCTHTGCTKKFRTMIQLTVHKRVHTGEKPYSCHVCSKSFATISGLSTHKVIHTGEKSFKCNVCTKCFKRYSGLYVHIMFTHKGEGQEQCVGQRVNVKSHTCGECGKSFPWKNLLTAHTKLHTGERAHTCEICGKGFIRPNHLRRHVKNLHST